MPPGITWDSMWEIHGQFRSYNRHEENTTGWCFPHLHRELKFLEEEGFSGTGKPDFPGRISIKPPVYRKTPLGREIADLLLAVNRPYGKSDLHTVFAGTKMPVMFQPFGMGHVLIWGRIQSREYMKRIGENETQKRIAYEVSVSKLEYV